MDDLLVAQIKALAEAETWYVPLLANTAALLYEALPDLNWAGFYLVRGGQLVPGPFQGKPACIHIARGKGVCGTAWAQDRTQRVDDVHAFPGHIACDGASNAEIVVPLHDASGSVLGVMDLDSPRLNRFTEQDQKQLEAVARVLEQTWTGWAEERK